ANEGQLKGAFQDYGQGKCDAIISMSDAYVVGDQATRDKIDAAVKANKTPEASELTLSTAQLGQACKIARRKTKACKSRNSQLQPHCMAIMAIGEEEGLDTSKGGCIGIDTRLMGMDLTAAGFCAVDCFSSVVNP